MVMTQLLGSERGVTQMSSPQRRAPSSSNRFKEKFQGHHSLKNGELLNADSAEGGAGVKKPQ